MDPACSRNIFQLFLHIAWPCMPCLPLECYTVVWRTTLTMLACGKSSLLRLLDTSDTQCLIDVLCSSFSMASAMADWMDTNVAPSSQHFPKLTIIKESVVIRLIFHATYSGRRLFLLFWQLDRKRATGMGLIYLQTGRSRMWSRCSP